MKHQSLMAILVAIGLTLASAGLPVRAQTGTMEDSPAGQQPGAANFDQQFATQAALSNLAELQMSSMALQKSTTPEVRQYAQQMVRQHSLATARLQRLAIAKGIALPTRANAQHQEMAMQLAALSGPAFDRAYMQNMVQDHSKAVALFQQASQQVQDPDMRMLAQQLLPTIQEHLVAAQGLSSTVASR